MSHFTHNKPLDHVASVTAHGESKYTLAVVAAIRILTLEMFSAALSCQAVSRKQVFGACNLKFC